MIGETLEIRPQPAARGKQVRVSDLPTHWQPVDEHCDLDSPTIAPVPICGQGDCLAPRFGHGTLVWLDPAAPIHSGDLVQATFADGTAVVKWLRRTREPRWWCVCRYAPVPIDLAVMPVVKLEKAVAWADPIASCIPPLPEEMLTAEEVTEQRAFEAVLRKKFGAALQEWQRLGYGPRTQFPGLAYLRRR